MLQKMSMVALVAGIACSFSASSDDSLVKFRGGIGVIPVSSAGGTANADGTFPSVTKNVVRGVNPPTQIWVIADLSADVSADGHIRVRGKGLLLAGGNAVGGPGGQNVFATLICEAAAPFTLRNTTLTGVPLQAKLEYGSLYLALTAYLGASAVGVLAGGFLADHTRRHGQVAAGCFAINAAIVLVIAVVTLPPLLLTVLMAAAGFLSGVIAPSRDMLVRDAAPAGAAGRAFGIVSTGFNFSGILAPLLFGWIMDQNLPHWVFGASVAFMILTVLLALATDRKPQAASGRSDPRMMHQG